jgi:hypothetical protein
MNASEILKALVSTGTTLHDAFTKAKASDAGLTLESFVKNLDLNAVGSDVGAVLKAVSSQSSTSAIAEIDAKQSAMLKGRSFDKLSIDELIQYSALSRARLLLTTQQLQNALKPNFLEWLVHDALPTLVQVVPTVLPLLL